MPKHSKSRSPLLDFENVKSDYDDKATLANVQAGLSWLFDGAGADDRLVFFFSGHGYQAAKGDNLEEVLCLYDEFLFDDVLSQKTQGLPPGVFTLVSDSCHSGGMYKMIFADGQTEIAQTKVLKVPPLAYQNKIFTDQAKATTSVTAPSVPSPCRSPHRARCSAKPA